MSFGRALIVGGAGSITEPGHPPPARFFPQEYPAIVSGEWVSFTRTANNEAINIVQAPDPGSLLSMAIPAKGVTPRAAELLTKHVLEIAFPDGIGPAAPRLITLPEAETKQLKKLRGVLAKHKQRAGIEVVRKALRETGSEDAFE